MKTNADIDTEKREGIAVIITLVMISTYILLFFIGTIYSTCWYSIWSCLVLLIAMLNLKCYEFLHRINIACAGTKHKRSNDSEEKDRKLSHNNTVQILDGPDSKKTSAETNSNFYYLASCELNNQMFDCSISMYFYAKTLQCC